MRFWSVIGLAFVSNVIAEHSEYKMRLHRNLLKKIADYNFAEILGHIEDDNIELNVGDTETRVKFRINPKKGSDVWQPEALDSELFFDQGQIVLELSNLELAGKGMVFDKTTGEKGTLFTSAPLEFCQVVMSPDQEVSEDGNLIPRLHITDVGFQLPQDGWEVFLESNDMPVHKTTPLKEKFQQAIADHVTTYEKDFKAALEKAEREVMKSFSQKKAIGFGSGTATSQLSEAMSLQGDNMVIEWSTEYEGADLRSYSKQMRTIRPAFSDDDMFKRDVHVVIDENNINYMLFSLFYQEKMFSVTEKLLNMFPDDWAAAAYMVQAVMNTKVIGAVFPTLTDEFGEFKKVDLRCSFDKNYLHQGKLTDEVVSHIRFKKGDKVEADLHFGCGVYVFNEESGSSGDDLTKSVLELFSQMETDTADPKWTQYRSVFMSSTFEVSFDTSASLTKPAHPLDHIIEVDLSDVMDHPPFAAGRVTEVKANIAELVVLKNGEVQRDEAAGVQRQIDRLLRGDVSNPVAKTIFAQAIPLQPFPDVARCLGLEAVDSAIRFEDGYVLLGFDYNVEPAKSHCLFNIESFEKGSRPYKMYKQAQAASKGKTLSYKDQMKMDKLKDKAGKLPKVKVYGEELNTASWFGMAESLAKISEQDAFRKDMEKFGAEATKYTGAIKDGVANLNKKAAEFAGKHEDSIKQGLDKVGGLLKGVQSFMQN